MFNPTMAQSPAMLLKEFQNAKLDLQFRDLSELPGFIKDKYKEKATILSEMKDGLASALGGT